MNPDEYIDVPVKVQFNADGTGTEWESDYGAPPEAFPFTWSTSGDQLTIVLEVWDPAVTTYSVTEHELRMTFIIDPSETWELRFAKLEKK